MTHHFVAHLGDGDAFEPSVKPSSIQKVYRIGLERSAHDGVNQAGSDVRNVLASRGWSIDPRGRDLLRVATAIYCADLMIPRNESFDNWTRHIVLHLSVEQPGIWRRAQDTLTQLLRFLTGDHWEVSIRKGDPPQWPKFPKARRDVPFSSVCLLSGGLDSFIGALDLLNRGGKAVLVGHHARGSGATNSSQRAVEAAIRQKYDPSAAPMLRYFVAPPLNLGRDRESTTRGRSLIFLALGISTAQACGAQRLVVPENGLISLNVPLSSARLGSLSTRTTHPYYISLVSKMLTEAGIEVRLDLPYRFKTKGEMVRECLEPNLLTAGLPSTVSCAHPESMRYKGFSPNTHCGYCIACLIRRAAVAAARIQDDTTYAYPTLKGLSGKASMDVKVLLMALSRYKRSPARMADVLRSGPLPGLDQERANFLEVYRQGLRELGDFLSSQGL